MEMVGGLIQPKTLKYSRPDVEIHLRKQEEAAGIAFKPLSIQRTCRPPFSIAKCNGRTAEFIRLGLTCYDEQFSFKHS